MVDVVVIIWRVACERLVFLACGLRAAIGVVCVRACSPLFFVAAGVPLGCGKAKGGGVGRVFCFLMVVWRFSGGCEVACE